MSRHFVRVVAFSMGVVAASSTSADRIDTRPWREASYTRVSVVSDLDLDSLEEVAEGLEWFHALVEYITGRQLESRVPPTIVVFRSARDFLDFAVERVGGLYMHLPYGPYVIVDGSHGPAWAFEIASHEYAHWALEAGGQRYPVWYNEGMAMILSQLRLSEETVVVGSPSRLGGGYFRARRSVPLRDLLSKGYGSQIYRDHGDNKSLHASGWAFTHFLFFDRARRRQLDRYLDSWMAGTAHEKAFESSFGRSIQAVEADLHRYLDRPTLPVWKIPLARIEVRGRAKVRTLARHEIQAILGVLAAQRRPSRKNEAERLLRDARRSQPQSAWLTAWLAYVCEVTGQPGEADELAAAARTLAADDPRIASIDGDRLLQRALGFDPKKAPDERRTAAASARDRYQKSLELDPELAPAIRGLALAHAAAPTEGDKTTARRALEAAHRALPSDPTVAFALGGYTAASGDVERARRLYRRARYFGFDPDAVTRAERALADATEKSTQKDAAAP